MAISVAKYAKAFIQSRDIEELLPFAAFLNDQTCAMKSGGAVACFRIQPVDDECLSDIEKNQITSHLIAAYNLLEPAYRQYQMLFRTRNYDLPMRATEEHSERVRELEHRRRDHLAASAKGATIEIFQAIEALPTMGPRELARLSPKERRAETRRLVRDLDLLARAYEIGLSRLQLQRLDKEECFALFHRMLHTSHRWDEAPPLRASYGLSRQLREASVYWDPRSECLRVGRHFVRVFTLKELPDASAPNLFGDLLKIDVHMTIVTTWQPQERLKTQEQLIQLRTLMINLERSGLSTRRAMRDDPALREALLNSGVRDDLNEINELLGAIRKKRHTGTHSLTVILHADKLEELDRPAAEIGKVFRLPMAELHEETGQFAFGTVIPAFFGTMPGNGHLNTLRVSKLRNDHHAELSTVWSCDTGVAGDDYANLYETRLGPLHRVGGKYQMVANRSVLGMTRQGKTTAEIDYIGALQIQRPITRVYDVGGSYEPLANYFGGSILRCSLGEWNIPVNPFTGPVKDDNFREFCFEFVRFLAESDGYEWKPEDSLQLHSKLNGLLLLNPKLRRLKTLHSNLEGGLKTALARWVEGGQYGRLFDHAEDQLVLADFQVFEFAKTEDGSRHPYLEALQTLLIYRDTQAMTDPAIRGRLKHITFDECVAHWRHPHMAEYIKRILKTLQKFNVSLSLVTQSPEDYGLLEPFVLQNCSSFCFFANPKITDTVLRRFGMDDTRIDVFRNLQPREFLFHGLRASGDLWKVLKLSVDKYRYWMYTTSPQDVVRREAVFAEYGVVEGLKTLAAGGAA